MKNLSKFLLVAGLTFLCIYPTIAQDYPLWLRDQGEEFDEYPTSISSTNDLTATTGFHQTEFEIFDLSYNPFHFVNCAVCKQYENIFVTWREESSANTWTALIFVDGIFNNHVDVQSAPQVDISSNGDVYVSFTYREIALVKDVSGNIITISNGNSSYDLAVVKFDANGDYQWHITEGNDDDDFITDLDYNENTNVLAIGGYVEGNSGLVLGGGAAFVPGITWPSVLGANFPYGNAFVATYEDNGGSANFIWSQHVKSPTFSTDVVQDDGGNVFLSGIYYETKGLAGKKFTPNYTNGGYIHQYFIVSFDHGQGTPVWAESYGSAGNELDITADKHLRHSSLAIDPRRADLFHAFESTGSNSGVFSEFGTYVNYVDPSNGSVQISITVGNTGSANGTTYPGSNNGSPTYNPNITVDDNGLVYISGNYLLSATGSSDIGIAFEDMEIGGTYVHHSMTNAGGNQGYSEAVGWYTAMVDMGGPIVTNENVNITYVPVNPNNVFNQLPVYGTAYDVNNPRFFYSVLGFNEGELELDLSVNLGVVNNYQNSGSSVQQYDGLVVRSYTGNGQHVKPATTTVQNSAQGDRTGISNLSGSSSTWLLSPNPVAAGQSLLWKSEAGEEVVDYIRLVDLSGRVVQEWNAPKATAQGFQLPVGELVTGTYLLEAKGAAVQQSTMVVVK